MLGRKHTPETKEKLRVLGTGRKYSDESKAKKSLSLKGRKHSPERCRAISIAKSGKHLSYKRKSPPPVSEETREKIRQTGTGRVFSAESRAKKSASLKGRSFSPQHVESLRRRVKRGSESHMYIDGRWLENANERQIALNSAEYRSWRLNVFRMDNFCCQLCGARNVRLQADHIVPWSKSVELRYSVDNGRTLCIPCHINTPTYGLKSRLWTGPEVNKGED